MMKPFEFNLKTRLKFGVGATKNLSNDLKEMGFRNIALIIDGALQKLPYLQDVLGVINSSEFDAVKVEWYTQKGEPDYDMLDAMKTQFCDVAGVPVVDCFVGIGGGSVLDTAKGLALLVVNHGAAIQYRGFPKNIHVPLPVIAIPTTAGTGSEVTYNASFIDHVSKKKMGINSMYNFPCLAILDPLLIASCPRHVAVASGMDALVHTMESYMAVGANRITRMFAKEAFALLFNNLLPAASDMGNADRVTNLQLGAYLAGVSLFNAGSGVAGALSYPLGVHFNVPHGMAGAVFIAHVVSYNIAHGYDYAELYDLIEGVDRMVPDAQKNEQFAKRFFALVDGLGVPRTLDQFGVTPANIGLLLNEVDSLEKAFAQNPIPYSPSEAKELLRSMV